MQIDIAGAPTDGAPTIESTGAAPKAGKIPGSFADLLNAVAEDQNESKSVDTNDEDCTGDEWMTVPVVVAFVPVIPQDIVVAESADATGDDAGVSEVAAAGIDAQAAEVVATPDVKSFVADEAAKPAEAKPQTEPAAAVDAIPVIEGQPIHSASEDQIKSLPEVKTDVSAPIDSKESVAAAEPTPKPGKSVKAAAPKTSEVSDVNKVLAAEASVKSAAQTAVAERVASNAEPSVKNTTNEPAATAKGVAARFARALERATERAIAPTAQAGESNQSSNQGGDGQPSFGEWLREQVPQLMASRGHNSANPAFMFIAPTPNDARVSGLPASTGANVLANAPSLPNEHDVNLQIVQSMRMQFRDGIGEAILKLKPEHLGSVSISLKVENGGLKANVQADMPAVRQWLESQQDTLRSALAEHGLRLDQFDVEPDAQRQQADDEAQRQQSRKRQTQKREAEQPVFEVVV